MGATHIHESTHSVLSHDAVIELRSNVELAFWKCSGAELPCEPGPCHRLEQIYFLIFDFLVRAADP